MLDGFNQIIDEFSKYNGFYKKTGARQFVYDLYKGKCAATDKLINLSNADIGHIVPRSEAEYFKELFPGLDCDNLINLHLLDSSFNRSLSNNFPRSPLAIYNAISYNVKLIRKFVLNNSIFRNYNNHEFDPRIELDKLYRTINIDYSRIYDNSNCFGNYHRLDISRDSKLIEKSILSSGLSTDDVCITHRDGIKSKSNVSVGVEDGYVESITANMTSTAIRDISDPISEIYRTYMRCYTQNGKVDIADGEYVFLAGNAETAQKNYNVRTILISQISVFNALNFIAADSNEKIIAGHYDDDEIYLLNSSMQIDRMCSERCSATKDRRGYQTSKLGLPEKIWFLGKGGTEPKLEYIAIRNLRKAGVDINSGALVLKRDYNKLVRSARKAVVHDMTLIDAARTQTQKYMARTI